MVRPRRITSIKDGDYYVYLRKSRKDLEREKWGEGETLARHEADLDEVAERNGYPVKGKFKEVVSGDSIAERKEFQKLMKLVEERKVSGVIVHAVDRLGRGSIDEYGWVIATLQRTRTLVITPSKVYDPNDPTDYMALVIAMIISEAELAEQRRRYRDGKNRSAKGGEYIGAIPPYGYDKAVKDRYKTLTPNDKADTVRMIFRRVASRELPGAIANDLNRNGIRSMKGRAWSPIVIKRIVQNPVYKGMIQWGSTRVEVLEKDGFKKKKKQVWQDADDIILEKGVHEAIVSEELWQKANDALASSPRVPIDLELKNALAGVLRCGAINHDGKECGQAIMMRGVSEKSRNRVNRYRHRNYAPCDGWKECSADTVLAMVVDSLLAIAGELDINAEIGESAIRAREEELSALRAELAENEYQTERLIDLYMVKPPVITVEAFGRRNAMLVEQKEALEKRIEEIEATEPPDLKALSLNVREVADVLKDPKRSAEYKNAMIKQVVDKITLVNHAKEWGKEDIEVHIFLKGVGNIEQ